MQVAPSVVATEVVGKESVVEDAVSRLPRLLKATMICTQVQRTHCLGGLVLDGPVALRRVWSFDLMIRLHSLLAWEKIHPWNQQYR